MNFDFDFELILFWATVITGVIALFDLVFLARSRKQKRDVNRSSVRVVSDYVIDYAKSFFPILLIVFLLRSFLLEPYRIPSGSLKPSLVIGDFPLINKFDYGIRLPVIHKKIIEIGEPKRGDIMVFHWPVNPSKYFIKRVIGLPGDRISYIDKTLYINGKKIPQTFEKNTQDTDESGNTYDVVQNQENIFGVKHGIFQIPNRNSEDYKDVLVPKGMYFVMGDNRDDSADSRYWGFVPDEAIVGKAIMVLMSWNSESHMPRWNRIFSKIH